MTHPPRIRWLAAAVAIGLIGPSAAQATAASPSAQSQPAASAPAADGRAHYFITFAEPGLLHYRGDTEGLAATAPIATPPRGFDAHSATARAYRAHLAITQATRLAAIETAIGRSLQPTHRYAITRSGIAAMLSVSEAAQAAAVPGIADVRPAGSQRLATFRGPAFIGADSIWNGSATADGAGTRGEGIVIGVLDTGAYAAHPSFADDPACGFGVGYPKLTAVDCSTSADGVCSGPNPEANPGNGHGVHTASTAAGNSIDNTATPAPALPGGVRMSGVAPCAAIRTYKVCQSESCDGAMILAGIENAIVDRVDVANFSISGGKAPWSEASGDFDAALLDLFRIGTFVAAAAGNITATGQDPVGLVDHLGPWVATVAASTQDETWGPTLSVLGTDLPPLARVALVPGTTSPSAPALSGVPIRSYPPNPAGCSDGGGIPPATFTDAIAVLRRGASSENGIACSFTEKIANAVEAGAIAVVVANNQPDLIGMDTTGAPAVPAFIAQLRAGDALLAFLADHESDASASLAPAGIGQMIGDQLGDFSLRGPAWAPYDDLTKPDIAAPGFNIYAAVDAQSGDYQVMSGTSMATPHVAGGAALVRAKHPEWTAMEVKSALLTTATNAAGVQEDGSTPWTIDEVGSGRIDLTRAALAGLTLDETYERFLAADPNGGTLALRDLNLPSLRDMRCAANGCTWVRTVVNRLATTGHWNASYVSLGGDALAAVTPSSFQLAPGASQPLVITAQPSASAPDRIAFGEIRLHEANGAAPDQHLSLAVKAAAPTPPEPACRIGVCTLRVDTTLDIHTAFGGTGPLLWLNRFTPLPADFPFFLTKVQTLFLDRLADGSAGAAVGDTFDVYVYQDDDSDPGNGATFLAGVEGVEVSAPLGQLQTIVLPNFGVPISGAGDVLIAIVYRGGEDLHPATADMGPSAGRSWIGAVPAAGLPAGDPERIFADGFDPLAAPDLAQMHLRAAEVAIPGWNNNWVVRGLGVKSGGVAVTLDGSAR